MADTIRIRRVASRWPRRKRYDIDLLSADGSVVATRRGTVGPAGFLIQKAGLHSTDSWDWVSAADKAFAGGSQEWVTWPYGDWRPSTQPDAPLRNDPGGPRTKAVASYDLEALSEDWLPVRAEDHIELIRELRREVPVGHVLHGLRTQPVARRQSRDDTIWWLPHRREWAWVHLTFREESDPQWPATKTFASWDDLLATLTD